MICDRYQDAVRDVAASNEKPDAKLSDHLGYCPRCRAILQAERELFSRIDSTLHARLNVDPPPSFLARVRAQLAKKAPLAAGSSAVWTVPGAALALVLIAMLVVNPRQQPRAHEYEQAPVLRAQQNAAVTPARHSNEDLIEPVRERVKKRAIDAAAAPQEPPVLVPPDEQKAFAQFVARVARQDAMAEAVVSRAADKAVARNTELPQVFSIDIADLQLDRAEQAQWLARTGDSE